MYEEVTFTCSIIGRNLLWVLNGEYGQPLKSYSGEDMCGSFTSTSMNGYNFSFLLGSNIDQDNGLFSCTSVMMMTSYEPGPVEIGCMTFNSPGTMNASDTISFNVLGK